MVEQKQETNSTLCLQLKMERRERISLSKFIDCKNCRGIGLEDLLVNPEILRAGRWPILLRPEIRL
jgi:hypothetical protein